MRGWSVTCNTATNGGEGKTGTGEMWAPWGPGRRWESESLYFFCYKVTVLQKARNHYQYRHSAVTESVTQPCGFVTKPQATTTCFATSVASQEKTSKTTTSISARNAVRNRICSRRSVTVERIELGSYGPPQKGDRQYRLTHRGSPGAPSAANRRTTHKLGLPPALPGRQQVFDIEGSPLRKLPIVSRQAHERELFDGRI